MSNHDGSKNVKLRQTMGKKNREIGRLRAQVAALQERVKVESEERLYAMAQVTTLTADLARVTGERDEQKKLRKTEVLAGLSLARQLNETRANLVALDQSKTAQFAAETLARSNAETALSAERARAKGMEEALTELLAAWSKIMTSCELPDPVMAIKIRRRASLAVSGQSPVTGRREACWSRSSPCPTYEHSHEIIALHPSPAKEPPCEGIKNGLRCSPCVDANRSCQPEGVVPPAAEKPGPCPDKCGHDDSSWCEEPAVAPVESLTEDEGFVSWRPGFTRGPDGRCDGNHASPPCADKECWCAPGEGGKW